MLYNMTYYVECCYAPGNAAAHWRSDLADTQPPPKVAAEKRISKLFPEKHISYNCFGTKKRQSMKICSVFLEAIMKLLG